MRLLKEFYKDNKYKHLIFNEILSELPSPTYNNITKAIEVVRDKYSRLHEEAVCGMNDGSSIKNKQLMYSHNLDADAYHQIVNGLQELELITKNIVHVVDVFNFINCFMALAHLCKTEEEMTPWEKTDDLQWVRNMGNSRFSILNAFETPDDTLSLSESDIDLTTYTIEEIESEIKAFSYDSIEDVWKLYGDASNQIIAECISENRMLQDSEKEFETKEQLFEHLDVEFGIECE